MIALIAALTIGTWRTLYLPEFRISPIATNYMVAVSWKPWIPGKFIEGPIVIDLYRKEEGRKYLVTSTVIDRPAIVEGVHMRCLPGPSRRTGMSVETSFLTTSVNGGQWSHLLVWHFDPKSFRPKQLLDVLMADDDHLNRGLVEENSFAKYVNPSDWPRGVKDGPTNIHRTWRFDRKTFSFKPGKWKRL